MSYYVYILHSPASDRFYSGFSKFHGKRLRQHRRGDNFSTSYTDDWVEVFCAEVGTRVEARELEKKIKSRGAKRFLVETGS